MDTGLLNLEEHFSTRYVYEDLHDASNSDDNKPYYHEWEDERELNGDIGLIPSSSFCESLKDISDIADSPPSLLFQKMIDWSNFIYVDGVEVFPHESVTHHLFNQDDHEIDTKTPTKVENSFDDKEIANFNLTSYINEPSKPKVKSAGKKIDKEGQKYIVDDTANDEIDVETVHDNDSLPVLEANDAYSLLEQFEASEKPLLSSKHNGFGFTHSLENNIDLAVTNIPNSPVEIFEKVPQTPVDIFEETEVEKKPEPEQTILPKSKQILEALPQELIARINESGKRKPITLIPAIPTKKRNSSRSCDNLSQHRNKIPKVSNKEQIQLDHDYCASPSPYPKEPQKDSGFQSAEEDDRSVIRNQPTVKTADGKLMVSLLKVNTIRNNQKKKLNLEEYKKRRFIPSTNTSQSNSPANSTCSSPLPEDENLKRIKHQEKLMKMATELLNTPAKSTIVVEKKTQVARVVAEAVPEKIAPPPDLEVKTYVSVATNTDVSSINVASTQQLEEIKPLLQKVSDKINSSSFITSLIENIPKVKSKPSENQDDVVREDKIIHFLKKDRLPVETATAACQTDFEVTDLEDSTESRYRRRMEEHPRSPRRRRRSSSSSSQASRSSSSSDSFSSGSSRSSRSRSRSFSPKRPRQYSAEHLREVEERRVIYVGRISKGTTKEDLRRRFMQFGTITNVSLHFRDYGDNYGFVTFANKEDAYEAVEHGNDGHSYPKYDLSFGGRRIFCKTTYSDLDNMREDDYSYYPARAPENSFDALLRAAQEKIRKRKS